MNKNEARRKAKLRPKLLVSFSGGKTSAYMSKLIKEKMSDSHELLFVFANTGQERKETLNFVRDCDEFFNLDLVWVEASVNPESGEGTSFKVTNYENASLDGSPFEEVIKKYGISNKAYPHCTRELKAVPIRKYALSRGWKDYQTAIGIRADEPNRIGSDPKFIYPMHDWMIDKIDVNNFWERMPFNLNLLEHQGNCSWCWKKSSKKHFMLIKESPEIYDFPERMEEKYGLAGHNIDGTKRVFFLGNKSTKALKEEYQLIGGSSRQRTIFEDENSGCSESCEAFA